RRIDERRRFDERRLESAMERREDAVREPGPDPADVAQLGPRVGSEEQRAEKRPRAGRTSIAIDDEGLALRDLHLAPRGRPALPVGRPLVFADEALEAATDREPVGGEPVPAETP